MNVQTTTCDVIITGQNTATVPDHIIVPMMIFLMHVKTIPGEKSAIAVKLQKHALNPMDITDVALTCYKIILIKAHG